MNHRLIYLFFLLLVTSVCVRDSRAQTRQKEVDAELWQKALDLHKRAFVFDAHAHKLVFGKEDQAKYYPSAPQLDMEKMKAGGVDGVGLFFAYHPIKNQTLYAKVDSDLKTLHKRVEKNNASIEMVKQANDISLATQNGHQLIVPGVEYFFGALNGSVSTIDSLYSLGIRVVTLMDNKRDRLSYSIGDDPSNRQLNILGQRVIERMNELGMLIDISHLDDMMQVNVIEHSDLPVIASHSPVRGVHHTPRNIPDHILKKLAQKEGSIMITFNSGDLAGIEEGRCRIDHLIDHIDHAVKVAGIDHVGIGSDFNGAGRRSPQGLEDASGFPFITYHMLKRGYTEDQIKKILGENYRKLLSEVMN